MKSWSILSHSALLVWRNRQDALKISGLLYLVAFIVQFSLGGISGDGPGMMAEDAPEMATPADAGVLLAVMVQLLLTLWIAVSWHRYVLLEEYPKGWLPAFHGSRMLGYFGRSVLLFLAVFAAAFIVALPIGLLAALFPPLGVVAPLAGLFVGLAVAFRLAPMLPGTATGQPLSLAQAFAATEGSSGTAIGLAFLGGIAAILIQLPGVLLMAVSQPLGLVVLGVTGWFVTMVSVSILTTIYGHYVEGRPIG